MSRLSPTATAVLTAIRKDPALAEASNGTLAQVTGRCERAISRALSQLVEANLAQLIYRRATGPGDVARYVKLTKGGE